MSWQIHKDKDTNNYDILGKRRVASSLTRRPTDPCPLRRTTLERTPSGWKDGTRCHSWSTYLFNLDHQEESVNQFLEDKEDKDGNGEEEGGAGDRDGPCGGESGEEVNSPM